MRIGVKKKLTKTLDQIQEDLNIGTKSKAIEKLIEEHSQSQKLLKDQARRIDEQSGKIADMEEIDKLNSIDLWYFSKTHK